jgi:hypothetical protein
VRHQPYRIDPAVGRELLPPADPTGALSGSSAPVLGRLR